MATKENKYLTLDALLEKSDLRQEDKYIPRLGAYVRMRELSAAEVFHIREQSTTKGKDGTPQVDALKNVRLSLAACLVEPKLSPEDVAALFEKSTRAVDELAQAFKEMNGATEESRKEAENSFRGQPGEEVPVQAGG